MSHAPHADFLSALGRIVGEAHVLTDGDLGAWEQDWRKRERGRALAVVRPASTHEGALVAPVLPHTEPTASR